ncbi:MAG TPA: NAD(P)/FAD-dependent oxidoreductase [Chloroflexota bacterium]|nr:NAD(P)/FAD-dependent oxidoreductase [Chloroflexota bacterium]
MVVGAGPNGLAAAVELARAGRKTLLLEAEDEVGGAARSAKLTLPGFVHDIGAAITPLAIDSPFMRTLPLEQLGLQWVRPTAAVAHPLDRGRAAILRGSPSETAAGLGGDGRRYERVMGPLLRDWPKIAPALLGPVRPTTHVAALARFAGLGAWPATGMIRTLFKTEEARGLMAGFAAHSVLPIDQMGTGAFALLFAVTGHATGWPFPRGGIQELANAMAQYFESLGGEIATGTRVRSLDDIPPAGRIMLDVPPLALDEMSNGRLPRRYRRSLLRFRRGLGVFKLDYALSAPIPWQAPEVAGAGTVHLGGTLAEIAAAEAAVARGEHPERPFVLLAQQSLFDSSRVPEDKHTAWAYCHVPNGSTVDMTDRIEAQIERFAPGFKDVILARSSLAPLDLQRIDSNLLGGDITGGAQTIRQIIARPVASLNPYRTPLPGVFLCSASTPPGGGVHGMCGYWAARAALRGDRRPSPSPLG